MNRLKSVLGYIWAIMAIPIVLATFINNGSWAKVLAETTGVEVSPRFTGGDIAGTQIHEKYRTEIHQPVFGGLLGERDEGFIQIDWVPKEEGLPPVIREEMDYNSDGSIDFSIVLNTRTDEASLKPYSDNIISVQSVLNAENKKVVRIRLKNDNEQLMRE
jgi:hypothetical protein